MSLKTGKAAAWVAAAALALAPMAVIVPDAMASSSSAAHSATAAPAAATATASVKNLTAKVTTNSITLGWTNPKAKHLSKVVVRYARGKVAPTSRSAGHAAKIASAKAGHVATKAVASGLAPNANYAFSVWAVYKVNGKTSYSHVLSGWTTTAKGSGSIGSGSGSAPVTITAGGSQSGSTGLLGGLVKDSAGLPLGGVTVTVENLATKVLSTVTSLPSGAFSLSNLPLGNYQVCFNATSALGGNGPLGYVQHCLASLPVNTSSLTSLPLTSLVPAGEITGTLSSLLGGNLSGVLVTATNTAGQVFTATSGANGLYTLSGLPLGSYNLAFTGSAVTNLLSGLVGTVSGLVNGLGLSSVTSALTENQVLSLL